MHKPKAACMPKLDLFHARLGNHGGGGGGEGVIITPLGLFIMRINSLVVRGLSQVRVYKD